jgi:hypothetical protein
MKAIRRHAVDREFAAQRLAAERGSAELGIKIMIEQSETRPLSSNIGNAISIAGLLSVIAPDSDELCAALRMAAAQSAGLFRLMVATPGEYPIALGDGRRALLHNIGVTSETHVGRWTNGFYLARIVRDSPALAQLASTPIADLRRSSSRGDDCIYLWAEVLELWHENRPGVVPKLQAALEATDPSRLKMSDSGYVLNVLVSHMQLLFRLIAGEPGPFNEALHLALERHKKYWSGRLKADPEGYLALGPLAFASMAHDAGITVEVESEYLPRRLYEGACRTA